MSRRGNESSEKSGINHADAGKLMVYNTLRFDLLPSAVCSNSWNIPKYFQANVVKWTKLLWLYLNKCKFVKIIDKILSQYFGTSSLRYSYCCF